MDQQRGRGDAQVMFAEAAGLPVAVRKIGDEILDGVEHTFLRGGNCRWHVSCAKSSAAADQIRPGRREICRA